MNTVQFYKRQATEKFVLLVASASILYLLSCFVSLAVAQKHGTSTLTIKVTGLTSSKGKVQVAVFDSEEQWLGKSVYAKTLEIKNRTCKWHIEGIPSGAYGIAVFHDQNSNTKNDSNFLGIPKEPYGFSNNTRGSFGPPKWKKVKFVVSAPTSEVEIKVK